MNLILLFNVIFNWGLTLYFFLTIILFLVMCKEFFETNRPKCSPMQREEKGFVLYVRCRAHTLEEKSSLCVYLEISRK